MPRQSAVNDTTWPLRVNMADVNKIYRRVVTSFFSSKEKNRTASKREHKSSTLPGINQPELPSCASVSSHLLNTSCGLVTVIGLSESSGTDFVTRSLESILLSCSFLFIWLQRRSALLANDGEWLTLNTSCWTSYDYGAKWTVRNGLRDSLLEINSPELLILVYFIAKTFCATS